MAGIADKLKKLTGAFSKKGNNDGGAPPFAAEPSPFG